jgi:oxaloacetate decarboxylase beta subunit
MDLTQIVGVILQGFSSFGWQNGVMIIVGVILIVLAVVKEYEPVLLLPIGFGCILANLGMSAYQEGGLFNVMYKAGIETEIFPLLIFVGVGAMIDFKPLLAMPQMVLLGAAGHFGVFGALILAVLFGFSLNEATSIGVIGAMDGPTAIYVATKLVPEKPQLLAAIVVAAYAYMSMIPVIQPPIMKLLTTKKERLIRMEYSPRPVSKRALIIFPIAITIVVSLIAPQAAPLIATLMLGNLLRECGVVDSLSDTAQKEIINICTLLLGLTVGATMTGDKFVNLATLGVLVFGLVAFVLDTVGGLLFAKLMAVITGGKINPLIGACGVSAFPMAGRLSAKLAQEEDFDNFILMHALGSNTGGQLVSVIVGGLLLAIVSGLAH